MEHPQGPSPLLCALLCAAGSVLCAPSAIAYDWLQFNGNPQHDGNNTKELRLGSSNVSQLTRKYAVVLPGRGEGSPVFLEQIATALGVKDLLFITTGAGHLLAMDAQTGATVWSVQYPYPTAPPVPVCRSPFPPCNTKSSPAIDPNRQFVYAYGLEGYVHKLRVGDGSEVLTGGWPQLVTLKPGEERISSALATVTVAGTSYLYVASAAFPQDVGNYQGHLTTINLATGTQNVFNGVCSNQAVHFAITPALPNCPIQMGGAWARAGVIYDPGTNRIFIATGNGTYDPANHHWGDSVVALNPDGTTAAGDPLDAYTPATFLALQNGDVDLGSTAPAILPVPANSNVQHLAVQGGKDGLLRLLNLANMSGLAGPGHTGGEIGTLGIPVPQGGQVMTQPAVWVNPADSATWVFVTTAEGTSAFKLQIDAGGNPSLAMQWVANNSGSGPSSPLIANNVLFLAGAGATQAVRALNPVTGGELWKSCDGSPGCGGTLAMGKIHWQTPVVANCALYVLDQSSQLVAFTLPAGQTSLPVKLAVAVNGGISPPVGAGFNVVVKALDCNSAVQNVATSTSVVLSLASGTGVLGGPSGCTILAGSNSCTVTGVTYSQADPAVVIAATRTGGDNVGPALSAPFGVGGPAFASRKVHGAVGPFDLPLGVVITNPTTEPRAGPAHSIVFTFQDVVTSTGTATVTEGSATVGARTFNGNELVVPLSATPDAQYVTVTVSNVALAGGGTGSGAVRIGFLVGDVNQNRVVSIADVGLVNAALAQNANATNFLSDVNASGAITLSDKATANANLTNALPTP